MLANLAPKLRAVANLAPKLRAVANLAPKLRAGASFVQTNPVFDAAAFEPFAALRR